MLDRKKIILVGTSHVSTESVQKIDAAIAEHKPQIICLELDKQRFEGLLHGHRTKFSFKLIRQIGIIGTLFVLIGSNVQNHIAKKIGTTPGIDMLHGFKKGRELGIKVALIDQPASITLKKLSKQFKKREIWYMVVDTVKSLFGKPPLPIKQFSVEKIPSQKTIDTILVYMHNRYPSLYSVLVAQRNIYMVQRLEILSFEFDTIVAVVGAAHKTGMEHLLNEKRNNHN